jgi:hypothetical protein
MRTIDLMLLKPYFHGTTRRSGAPFWFGSTFAVQADRQDRERVHRLVDAQPLDVGPVEHRAAARHLLGIAAASEGDVLRREVGSKRFSRSPSGKPTHGITIDHASTQRRR